MDIMTSVVMIGLRMKSSGMFIGLFAPCLFFNLYFCPRDKPQLSVSNDFFTRLQTLLNDRFTVDGSAALLRGGIQR